MLSKSSWTDLLSNTDGSLIVRIQIEELDGVKEIAMVDDDNVGYSLSPSEARELITALQSAIREIEDERRSETGSTAEEAPLRNGPDSSGSAAGDA